MKHSLIWSAVRVAAATLSVLLTAAATPGTALAEDANRPALFTVPAAGGLPAAAVSISGNIAVFGVPDTARGYGAAYVYLRTPSGWRRKAAIYDPLKAPEAAFGNSVAVSGTTILIGSPGDHLPGYRGRAYFYVLSAGRWHQQAIIGAPAGQKSFGWAVGLSEAAAIIGAPGGSGYADIFARSGSAWSLTAQLTSPNHQFGLAVAIDHGTAAAEGLTSHLVDKAYVYARDRSGWHLDQVLAPYRAGQVIVGLALSGSTLASGAIPGNDPVTVYARSARGWHLQARLPDPITSSSFSAYGWSLAVSGTRLVAGAPLAGKNCGIAYEFTRSGAKWREKAVIENPHCAGLGFFGLAVGVSGRTAMIAGDNTVYLQQLP